MDKKVIEQFKLRLIELKEQIINGENFSQKDDFYISQDDLSDEADLATTTINQDVSFRIREQEMTRLRRINAALERIQMDAFGCCEECDGPIGEKRLTHQPWSELCIVHAEEKERDEMFGPRKVA